MERSATVCVMDSVGVREVRQYLSRYLDRVRSGESLLVTERGHPVAVLSPVTPDPLEDMRSRGVLREASATFVDFRLPEPLIDGRGTLSSVLEEMRNEEGG